MIAKLPGAALAFWLAFSAPAKAADTGENDPLEPVNRVIFTVNTYVMDHTARPVARLWIRWVPQELRNGLRNGLENLGSPLVFGNHVLQGEAGASVRTLARFFLNSTVGIAGTIDVAQRLGIPREDTDLGITAGRWGSPEGPYLVLPLLGPFTLRDASASFAEGSADPFNLWVRTTDYSALAFVLRFFVGNLDHYSRNMDQLDTIRETSIDFYAAVRSYYRQNRWKQIRTLVPDAPLDEIDYGIDYE